MVLSRPPDKLDANELSDEARATLREVAVMLAAGYRTDEIAKKLGVRRRDIDDRLDRLRDELPRQG